MGRIVTADTDFGEILAQRQAAVPSLDLFRVPRGRPSVRARLLLDLTLAYHFDVGEGGSLVVDGAESATGGVFARDLYQFVAGQPPRNGFQGGHGFTGLNYLYPPGTTVEGQFFCEVQEAA